MPIPINAFKFTDPMDPKDNIDFLLSLSGVGGILEAGETIASYTLALRPESTALGLTIGTGSYAPSNPTASQILFWLSVDPTFQANTSYDGAGVILGVEVTITTTSTPARVRQRTVAIQVAQQ